MTEVVAAATAAAKGHQRPIDLRAPFDKCTSTQYVCQGNRTLIANSTLSPLPLAEHNRVLDSYAAAECLVSKISMTLSPVARQNRISTPLK